MTDINANQHSVREQLFVKTEVEQIITDLGVDLSEDIGCNRKVELLGSLESDALGDDVVLVARVFDSLVLVLTGQKEYSDLRFAHSAFVLF